MEKSDFAEKSVALYTVSMSRNQIVFVIGLLLVFISFSGFPSDWKFYFYIFAGLILMLLAARNYWLRREMIRLREARMKENQEMSHV